MSVFFLFSFQVLPKNCASMIAGNVNKKKAKAKVPVDKEKPGDESKRKHREEFTRWALEVTALSLLDFGIVLDIYSLRNKLCLFLYLHA